MFKILLPISVMIFLSCKPEDTKPKPVPQPEPAQLQFSVLPCMGSDTLLYNTYYSLDQGDTLKVSKFNVFIFLLKFLLLLKLL